MYSGSIWFDNRSRMAALLAVVGLAFIATLATTGKVQAASASVISSLGCPATAVRGQAINCVPAVQGNVSRWSWQANNDDPQGGSHAATFTTTFNRAGNFTVHLEACDGRACANKSAEVRVTVPPRPRITSLGCPNTTPVGQPVTCTAVVSGTVTSYRWHAENDTPGANNGPAFTTSFNSNGFKTVYLEVCNGNACDDSTAVIRVTRGGGIGPVLPAPVIIALSCPGATAAGVPITCLPDVTGTVTAWHWTTPTGVPATGSAPTFTTTYSAFGNGVVTLQACNGTSCTTLSENIAIVVGDD